MAAVWERVVRSTSAKARESGVATNSPMPHEQIDNEHDEQNAADADATAVPPPGIAKATAEEEDQYENDEDQVHRSLP